MIAFLYGNLLVVWIILENITANSGHLHYYPGSHKLPYIMNCAYNHLGTKYKLGSKIYSNFEVHIEKIVRNNKLEKNIWFYCKFNL